MTEVETRVEAMRDLKKQLRSAKMTQVQLANNCGKSPGWIGNILRGNYPYYQDYRLPRYLYTWFKIAKFNIDSCLKT